MSIFTAFLNLLKKDPVADKDDTFNISTMLNDNWDKIDAGLKNISKFPKSTGTTAIEVTTGIFNLVDGQSFTFIPTGNNGGSATTINADGKGARPLYKPTTTDAPKVTSGKPITVWYDLAGDRFFIKASAEGNAVAAHVLAPNTFSNGDDVGIVGTMVDYTGLSDKVINNQGGEYVVPQGYHSGFKVTAAITGLIASVVKAGTTVGGILGTFTSDATATAANILSGATAYVNGNKITGTMVNRGAVTITPTSNNQAIPAGYHSGSGIVEGVHRRPKTFLQTTQPTNPVKGDKWIDITSAPSLDPTLIIYDNVTYIEGETNFPNNATTLRLLDLLGHVPLLKKTFLSPDNSEVTEKVEYPVLPIYGQATKQVFPMWLYNGTAWERISPARVMYAYGYDPNNLTELSYVALIRNYSKGRDCVTWYYNYDQSGQNTTYYHGFSTAVDLTPYSKLKMLISNSQYNQNYPVGRLGITTTLNGAYVASVDMLGLYQNKSYMIEVDISGYSGNYFIKYGRNSASYNVFEGRMFAIWLE